MLRVLAVLLTGCVLGKQKVLLQIQWADEGMRPRDASGALLPQPLVASSAKEVPKKLAELIDRCFNTAPVANLARVETQVVDVAEGDCPSPEDICHMLEDFEDLAGESQGISSLTCEKDQPIYIVDEMGDVAGMSGENLRRLAAAESSKRRTQLGTTNDPLFERQWSLHEQDMTHLWQKGADANPVVVAVLDTGIDFAHPDLQDAIYTNPGEIPDNGIDDDGNGKIDDVHGWDFVSDTNNPADDTDHGTHCAGIISAATNNSVGIASVAGKAGVKIMPLKVLSRRGGDLSSAIEALNYALDMGVPISSNSFGGPLSMSKSKIFRGALDMARANGHFFVAAAGNARTNIDAQEEDGEKRGMVYPCGFSSSHDNVLCVTSVGPGDQFSWFGNYGAESVQLAGPGGSILSTVRGGGYRSMSGTSQATPFVAGAAALMVSASPNLEAPQLRQLLLQTSRPHSSLAERCEAGSVVDVAAAVAAAEAA